MINATNVRQTQMLKGMGTCISIVTTRHTTEQSIMNANEDSKPNSLSKEHHGTNDAHDPSPNLDSTLR